jgi:alpha-1,2-mannosyltransferase
MSLDSPRREGDQMSTVDLRRTLPWFLGALGTAVLVALLMQLSRGPAPWWLVDFSVYRFGAETILGPGALYLDTTPYTLLSFTYPPIAALLFVPFTLGSLGIAGFAWVTIEALFLVGAIWLTLGAVGVREPKRRASLTVPLAALAPLLAPVDYDFAFGQLNAMLMFMVLLDLVKGDGRRWQGIAIGVAAGIKLIPLIFVVYLACTGRIRAAATALGAFAATVALGFAVLPAESMSYWFGPGLSVSRPGIPMGPLNQGLRGVFARMLGTDQAVHPLWLAAAAVVGLLGLAAAVALHRKGFPLRGILVCALTALLVSPVSWVPHWVWVVPLLIVLASLAWRGRSAWWLAVTVVTAAVFGLRLVFWLLPLEAFLPAPTPANLDMAAGHQLAAATYALLALGLVVALASPVLRRTRRRPDHRQPADAPSYEDSRGAVPS